MQVHFFSAFFLDFCTSITDGISCSTMVLTDDGWEDKGLQDLFLQLIKLRYSPHLCFYNLSYVCSLFQTGEALFIHFTSGRAQSKLRG